MKAKRACDHTSAFAFAATPVPMKIRGEICPKLKCMIPGISLFYNRYSKGKITEELVSMLMCWRHSGFNVFCGPRIYPRDETAMENLARYIIRASFSQKRMSYLEEEAQVLYRSKDSKEEKVFDTLQWLVTRL